MLRRILAILLGGAAAFGIVALVESMGHSVYPLPDGFDFTNPEQVAKYVKQAPMGALLFVIGAWVLAVVIGGIIAAFIARKLMFVFIIGGLVLVAAVVNLFMIPHPTWFTVTGVLALVAAMYITRCLAKMIFRLS